MIPHDLSKETQDLIAAAALRVAEMDRLDYEAGSPTPLQCGIGDQLAVIITALGAAINRRDWDCVAEAMVMAIQAKIYF